MHGKRPYAPRKRDSATAIASPRPKIQQEAILRDNQERYMGASLMEQFKYNPIDDMTQPNKLRRRRKDLQPIQGEGVHPIIKTSLEADSLDQRLNSIKLQIDHVLLGGMLKESPRKPTQAVPMACVELRPMTTTVIEPSPVSMKSVVIPPKNADGSEIMMAQKYLCADAEIEKWIQTYELEKDQFTSFALFTEYKLNQLTNFTVEAGRPNVIETAACFAALYKIPGILGNYRSLLQKIIIGLEYSIYGTSYCEASFRPQPDFGFHKEPNPLVSATGIADIVRSFYQRKPFFVQLRELDHDHTLTMHLGLPPRSSARSLSDEDKARVIETCSVELLERGLQRFPDNIRQSVGMKLVSVEMTKVEKSDTSKAYRQILKLCDGMDNDTRTMVVASILEDVDDINRVDATFRGLGFEFQIQIEFNHISRPQGEALLLERILGRIDQEIHTIREVMHHIKDPICLSHMYFCSGEPYRIGFLRQALSTKLEYEFICNLAQVLSPSQLDQLYDFVNGAKQKSDAETLPLTPESLHNLFTTLEATVRPFSPIDQKRLFGDVCRVLQSWTSSEHINLSHFLVDTVKSLVPSELKAQLVKTFLRDDTESAIRIICDYIPSLSLAERRELESHLSSGVFLLEPFKKNLSSMSSEMRLNVIYHTMEIIARDLDDQGISVENAKPVKSIQHYCRELFGLTLSTASKVTTKQPRNPVAAQSNSNPTIPEPPPNITVEPPKAGDSGKLSTLSHAVSTTIEILHQLDHSARAAIFLSLAQSLALPKGYDELPLDLQIVSSMSPTEASGLITHDIGKSSFEDVLNRVVTSFAATGQTETVDSIVNQAIDFINELPESEQLALDVVSSHREKLVAVQDAPIQVQREQHNSPSPQNYSRNNRRRFSDGGLKNAPEVPVISDGHSGLVKLGMETFDEVNPVVQKRKPPVTVATLLKKSKNKKGAKLDRSVIPTAFASLVTSWKINTDQLSQFCKKPLGVVLRIIADVYIEKLMRSKKDRQERTKANSLSRICYQTLLHSYGLPSIADMHLIALGCALDLYRTDNLRVDMFCKFIYNELPTSYLKHFLVCLESLLDDSIVDQFEDSNGKKGRATRLAMTDRVEWDIPLERAMEVAAYCLQSMRSSTIIAFCERLSTIIRPNAKSPRDFDDTSVINADVLLNLIVNEWADEQIRRENHLLDAFRAGDNNGDGVLSLAEFQRIVLSIDKSMEDSDILLMFSETLRRTGTETIDPETFLHVAKENGLDTKAWDSDEDLSSIVNSIDDLNQVWASMHGFFVGTIEALARDIPPSHSLRKCSGAGCGCLKCLLEGYSGFQVMLQNTHEHTLEMMWKRYWHLMNQLLEATEQFDGVITPWANSLPIRTQPSPPLPPRTNTMRRNALPAFLLPDITRITSSNSESFREELILSILDK
ncbi:hypothetical protein THRCLA_08113 [Thraustotheca clavata]|uniref:EF-hand domain-containing protein n=1 Tax=Thraustotheca clavata TaxID=74557 RepID=A0A1V9Z9T7_9STRA|nr:hypothetical protein THRCLA_08113 [Thraustotheca clavata]